MSRRPVVVKLGTSLIAAPGGRLRRSLLGHRAREIAELVRGGTPVVVVSSGAIALGLPRLGLTRRPPASRSSRPPRLSGQVRLQAAWDAALGRHGIAAAQVLLTAADISDRVAYVNARNTLTALFRLGAVSIVNENDVTATDEITFGDNDALAAQVAVLVRARLLVLLTEVEGVFSRAPGTPGAELITEGSATRDAVLGAAARRRGKGGMRSKVLAAEMAASAGIQAVIAGGANPVVLAPILAGELRGTVFEPRGREDSAFKLWLRFGKPVAGQLHVDEGARRAVVAGRRQPARDRRRPLRGPVRAGRRRRARRPGRHSRSPRASPASRRLELEGRPRGVEAVHRDRLVAY